MSVRVHAIAKQVNKTSKELIQILTERGYDIKSASASIDNITAQSLIDEFLAEAGNVGADSEPDQTENTSEKPEKAKASKKAPIVKSKAEIEERGA